MERRSYVPFHAHLIGFEPTVGQTCERRALFFAALLLRQGVMDPSEWVKAIEPRFHPNPPPKSTTESRRNWLTDKNVLKAVRRLSPGTGPPESYGPDRSGRLQRSLVQDRQSLVALAPVK